MANPPISAVGNAKANVSPMVDLRGPAPKIGFKFRVTVHSVEYLAGEG
jgi:hypothetical protein